MHINRIWGTKALLGPWPSLLLIVFPAVPCCKPAPRVATNPPWLRPLLGVGACSGQIQTEIWHIGVQENTTIKVSSKYSTYDYIASGSYIIICRVY